jgi:hypothetical protein
VTDKNKSVGPDKVSGQFLEVGGEATILYLVRLLDITINDATIPSERKKVTVVPIYKGGDRSLVSNYRSVSLTSVVSKRIEHIMAPYLREIWVKKNQLFAGQHGLRLGFSCRSLVITVCQDTADFLDNTVRTDAIIIDFSKPFILVPQDQPL